MEPEVRFERIEALLHAMAERENQMEIRFNRSADQAKARMDRADQRMEKFDRRVEVAEKRFETRMEAAEKRSDKFDLQLQATRRLVEAGMKIVVQLGKSHRELEKSQKAFLDSLRKGGNGNGRRSP